MEIRPAQEAVIAALATKSRLGRARDGVRRAQPGACRGRRLDRRGRKEALQHFIFPHVGGSVAFENNRSALRPARLLGAATDFFQPQFALFLRKPDDLERTVAFQGAGGVVVNRLAGSRQEAGSGIVVIHDEHGVRLVALEGDADHHLAECAAGQRVSAAQGL